MTIKQRVASFKLSYALAMVAAMKEVEKPKSRLWNQLDNLEDHIGRVLDEYRIEQFSIDDLRKAEALFHMLDDKIKEMYQGVE